MKRALEAAVVIVGTVLCVHALTYVLIAFLPSAAVSALGVFAADKAQVARFTTDNPIRPYRTILHDAIQGDMGRTLDGTRVSDEICNAASASLPLVAAALLGSVVAGLSVGFLPKRVLSSTTRIAEMLAFFPPFVGPSLALAASIVLVDATGGYPLFIDRVLITAGLAFPCAALAIAQGSRITAQNLGAPFVTTMRAVGMPERRIRWLLLRNLAIELAPSLENIAVVLVMSLLLAEVIFGSPGLGTLTARAIRRSDLQLLLALAVLYGGAVAVLREGLRLLRVSQPQEQS